MIKLCESIKNYFTRTDTYVVPKGEHYAIGRNPSPINLTKRHKWEIRTNETWAQQGTQANKVIGVSAMQGHHKDSWRLCYSYEGGILWRAYRYDDGKRSNVVVASGNMATLEFKPYRGEVLVYLNGQYIDKFPIWNRICYTLGPYFGGADAADWDWKVIIKKL